jgi:hypothetical protein
LIPIEDKSPSYFLGPVGTSDPLEFIEAESQRIPFKAALSRPHEWQDTFKNYHYPQLQVGETGIRGYLMMTLQKSVIGTAFALPSVWSYPWLKFPRMRIF